MCSHATQKRDAPARRPLSVRVRHFLFSCAHDNCIGVGVLIRWQANRDFSKAQADQQFHLILRRLQEEPAWSLIIERTPAPARVPYLRSHMEPPCSQAQAGSDRDPVCWVLTDHYGGGH
jgi:hypothetical protein